MSAGDSARPSQLLTWSTAALPVLVVVAVDPGGWFPFGPAKWAVVSATGALLLIGLGRTSTWRLPRMPMVTWCLLVALLTLASAFGRERWYSWIGTPERHLGVLTWVLFLVAFVAGFQLWPTGLDRFARAMALAALWTGGYAVVEYLWRAPVGFASDSSRLGGPFGSPAYLGAATCLLVPVAAAVAVDDRQSARWRVVGGVGALTCVVAALGSGTRAAWLGLGATALLAVAFGARGVAPVRRTVLVAGVCLVVAVAVVAPAFPEVIERTAGAASRLDEWQVAARVTARNPVLGVGAEGYRVAFAEGVDDNYELTYGRMPLPDRAHAGPLDVATAGGIPAAALYVVLLTLVAWSGVRMIRRGGVLAAGVASGAIAYLGQQLLLFPLAELDPVFWIAAGATVAGSGLFRERHVDLVRTRAAVVGAGGALVAAAAVAGVLDLAADRLARRAVETSSPAAAAVDAERAAALRPDVVRYHLLAAAANETIGTLRAVDDAVAATARALDVSPSDPIARQRHAATLLHRAEITGAGLDGTRAVDAYDALADGDPACFECLLGLGRAYALQGDADGAERAWVRADELTERDERPAAWLARLYGQQGRSTEAAVMNTRAAMLATVR